MGFFSEKFSTGDIVHTARIDQAGSTQGEIVATSDIGVTIEYEQPHSGVKAYRFIPWTNISSIHKPV